MSKDERILMLDPHVVILDMTPMPDKKLLGTIREADQIFKPILVYMDEDSKYHVLDGRNRTVCARELEIKVPARVTEVTPLLSGAAIALSANVAAKNPLVAALKITELEEAGVGDDSLLALSGMSKTERKATKRLLNLAQNFQDLLLSKELSVGAAKELARLSLTDQDRAWRMARDNTDRSRVPARLIKIAVRDIIAEQHPRLQIPRPQTEGEFSGTGIEVAKWLRGEANVLSPHRAEQFVDVAKFLEERDGRAV